MKKMKKTVFKILWVLLGACVAVSLYMRALLFNMGYEYDELFSAITSDPSLSLSWIWRNWLIVDVHPPLYNVILWGWNHFVPYGPELWLRFPSFLLGLGALAGAWFLFPRRFGKTARLVFTALVSCNLYMIAYSQHARSYMLVLLFSIPLTFLFLNMSRAVWKKREITARQWVCFGVLSLLLCWSHYFGALLFGWYAVILFAQALYWKRKLKWFIIVPCLVFIGFLPWLAPNFMLQLEYRRFGGNWWANQIPYRHAGLALLQFFFVNPEGGCVAAVLAVSGAVWAGIKYKGLFPYRREFFALAAVIGLFLLSVALVSIKTYMFVGRYFTSLIPACFLSFTFLLVPLLRRSILAGVLLVGFLVLNMGQFWNNHRELLNTPQSMPARVVSQLYRDSIKQGEMFVVALEAFPPASMPALYGFYVNKVYGLHVPVTELVSLSDKERNRVLERRQQAFIWMPNCTSQKLKDISTRWNRTVNISAVLWNVCFLDISDIVSSPAGGAGPAGETKNNG